MLTFLKHFLSGIGSVFLLPASPLYRYPYRANGEALRGDWLKIGRDVESALTQGEAPHE